MVQRVRNEEIVEPLCVGSWCFYMLTSSFPHLPRLMCVKAVRDT